MKAYLIDGKAHTVTQVEYDGTVEGLNSILPYPGRFMDGHAIEDDLDDGVLHRVQNMGDTDMEKLAETDGGFGFICPNCDDIHTIFGKGMWVGRQKKGENDWDLADPTWSLEQVRKFIKWPHIHIVKGDELQEALGPILGQLHDAIHDYVMKKYGKKPEEVSEPELMDAKSAVAAMLATQSAITKH